MANIERLLNRVFKTTLLINSESEYCAFFSLSPHVEWAEVRIAKGKRGEDYREWVATFMLRYSNDWEIKGGIRELDDWVYHNVQMPAYNRKYQPAK